jgi:putative restriction endonuclease
LDGSACRLGGESFWCVLSNGDERVGTVLARLAALRQHRQGGQRSPHKPLLVLLALGRLSTVGSSELPWSAAEPALGNLIAEFGPVSVTGRAQSAAYPFTRLRADGIWVLDADVPMDLVSPLASRQVTGHFEESVETALRADPELVRLAARSLVLSNSPETLAPDVLEAVGLDPDAVLGAGDAVPAPDAGDRRRSAQWRSAVLLAWDRQCAFCGYYGQLGSASAGIEAAHVRWFSFGGPDALDNGLALCVLHHKLFDLGVLGLDAAMRVPVSAVFTAPTTAGRAVYDLHGHELQPRSGTTLPASRHVSWHTREVFKGRPLAA